jgi:hypothetical protein
MHNFGGKTKWERLGGPSSNPVQWVRGTLSPEREADYSSPNRWIEGPGVVLVRDLSLYGGCETGGSLTLRSFTTEEEFALLPTAVLNFCGVLYFHLYL